MNSGRIILGTLAAAMLSGCAVTAVVNVGGTVNVVPVSKLNGSGCMTSETVPTQENPSTTTVKIPMPGGAP